MNYVGSLDLRVVGNTFSMSAKDREAAVSRLLAERYPKLSGRFPVVKRLTEFGS